MQFDASNIKKQLVSQFLPDDMCPQGLQSFMDAPENIYQCDSNESKAMAEVITFESLSLLFLLG